MVMGASGIVAQILLLRELLIVFQGNELSIGVILANWLILEACGAFFFGRIIDRRKSKVEFFVIVQIAFCVCFTAAVYFSRNIKAIIGIAQAEALGLFSMIAASLLILFSVSIAHGALFTFCCKLYDTVGKESRHASSIGRVYILEAIGTLIGGVLLTYVLIPRFNSIKIALAITGLNLIVCILLLGRFWLSRQRSTKIVGSACLLLLLLAGAIVLTGFDQNLNEASVANQWPGQHVLHYENSIHGNVAVTAREGQYTFFSDGVPIITTPTPNTEFVEEFIHLPMLSHPEPMEILIISGGAGGIITEVLRHSVKKIDYVELDPLILKLVKRYSTALTDNEFRSPELQIHYQDGRYFVAHTDNKYDLIFIGFSYPRDLQVNRLYTKEFFIICSDRLKTEGLLVLNLPGSLTYLSRELSDLNRCIINTLQEVYPYTRKIPGDVNLYLASRSGSILSAGHSDLTERYNKRKLDTRLLTPDHIMYKLHPRWLERFIRSVERGTDRINRDFQPAAVYYSLAYWNALFAPGLRRIFTFLEGVNLWMVLMVFTGLTLLLLGVGAKFKSVTTPIPLCVATTGFAGMLFDLVLIFAFQILYGYVFHWIGIIISAIMAGTALGGHIATITLKRTRNHLRIFMNIELAVAAFTIILPIILTQTNLAENRPLVFLPLALFSGILVGLEFPLANHIYLSNKPSSGLSHTAGLFYGADLIGGWLAGIAGGIFLLPLFGLLGACIVLCMLKLSTLVALVWALLRSR